MLTSLLKPDIKKWLDKSIQSELYASNLYKHLSNQMQRLGLFGAQKYFEHESEEELTHYGKLKDYVNDMQDVALIPAIDGFSFSLNSISDALNLAYKTELDLLKQYQDFYEDAEEGEDCITATFIQEFLMIQRKSVGQYGDLISRFERNGDIYEFDKFMAKLVK